jgi:hypothetical protein
MRWGLVPFWAKDVKVAFANINAKAEGMESKPAQEDRGRQPALCDRARRTAPVALSATDTKAPRWFKTWMWC